MTRDAPSAASPRGTLTRMATTSPAAMPKAAAAQGTALGILGAISLCHGLNDLLQSVIPAVYPILKTAYRLDFGQIGLITFANTTTASLLQPVMGFSPPGRFHPQARCLCHTLKSQNI